VATKEHKEFDLRILYLEDSDEDWEAFSRAIENALEGVAAVDVVRAKDNDEAVALLKAGPKDWGILLVDWYIGEGQDRLNAARTIGEAVKHENIAIIGLSSTEVKRDSDTFYELGGHYFFPAKPAVKNWLEPELRRRLQIGLHKVNRSLRAYKANWDRNDLKLRAEMEEVGEKTLGGLLWMLLPHPDIAGFTAHYLTPGRSGASVIRVEIKDRNDRTVRRLVVKLSREKGKLQKELDNARRQVHPLPDIYVPYLKTDEDEPANVGDWYAIAQEAKKGVGTRSLDDWLTANSPQDARTLLTDLFRVYLKESEYSEPQSLKGVKAFDLLRPKGRRLVRVLAAIENLAEPLRLLQPGPGDQRSAQFDKAKTRIVNLIEKGTVADRSLSTLGKDVAICWSHGDLHSQNILVDGARHPWLIDAADRAEMHWARDPAQLAVDLWIAVHNNNEALFWGTKDEPFGNIYRWRDEILRWLENTRPQEKDYRTATPVMAALLCLREIVSEVFDGCFDEWQFRLALLMQFLVFTSYEQIPAPKRCLSLVVADALIQAMEEELASQPAKSGK
jgi:hypothetical protein